MGSPDTIDGLPVCGTCAAPLLRTRYVMEQASSTWLRVFCSEDCLRAAARVQSRKRWLARRRSTKWLTVSLILLGGCLTPHQGPPGRKRLVPPPALETSDDSGRIVLPAGWFGPEWPPTETSVLAALGRDAWVHPMSGPIRRMPRSDARVFGAGRPGERPIECRNGHCGVDLGGEIWGEHVHAVHDGVVDWVQRGPNPDHGGEFVRISHRNGTVFTQYFHLAAIPRWIERGAIVASGDVIGLLGDTGVKQSEPHLHFAMSIRPAKDWPEKYIDPEPLIALWPLRVPLVGTEVGLVTIVAEPGAPLGSALRSSRKQRKPSSKPKKGSEETAGAEKDGTPSAAPPDEEPAVERVTPDIPTEE